jgi:peptide chain release factor subunit 1
MMEMGEGRSMAISKADLESLIGRTAKPGTCVLSVYLNVDQSRSANLNRGYLRCLKERLRACGERLADETERKNFVAASGRVLNHVSTYGGRGRTVVMFMGEANGLFWERELQISMESTLRWEEKPYVRPLVEAIDEYERYGVVLVDREKGRLFTVYLGQTEEHRDVFSEEKRKYFKKTSKDTTLSQPRFQRREEEHALWHLKDVAGELEHLAAGNKFDRLILAGQHEITTELQGILSKKLHALVVRHLALPIDASEQAVLRETMRVEEEVERANEAELVERLITAAAKDSQGVLEMQPTLDATRQGRILRLVYVHDFAVEGSQCRNCQSLFAGTPASCAYCGGELRPIPDIVAGLADMVFYSGGQPEDVRGPAADRLRAAGSIGAFLRY